MSSGMSPFAGSVRFNRDKTLVAGLFWRKERFTRYFGIPLHKIAEQHKKGLPIWVERIGEDEYGKKNIEL